MRKFLISAALMASTVAIAAPAAAQWAPPAYGYGQQPYGNAYGYQGQRYAAQGDLTFRCNVDYRGAVTSLRVRPNRTAYNRGY